jgi:tRNA nucleotidyltransferase/poly(A) polymerase
MNLNNIKHGLPITEIKELNGQVYFVGGIVRDFYCNKTSKDIDVVITNVEFTKLYELLTLYGKVDLVGESFGIIKYKAPGCDEVDVALPRTERKISSGYQGFEIYSNPTLPIETDLYRRDFTINAIAVSIDGDVIDPFNGVKDIENRTIRMVNPDAFSEDPLRMLRAIQFSARFGFKINDSTFNSIYNNSYKIKEISVERWLIELDKVLYKAPTKIHYAFNLLLKSGLYEDMFSKPIRHFSEFDIVYDMTRADFYFNLIYMSKNAVSEYFKENLKGDIETYKTIKAIEYIRNVNSNNINKYYIIYNAYKISNDVINTNEFKRKLGRTINYMRDNNLPISLKEMDITGDDIIELIGQTGKIVGTILDVVLDAIYSGHLKNSKPLIIKYIKNNYA